MARDLATRGGEDCDSALMARLRGAVERGCLVSGEVDRQGGGAEGRGVMCSLERRWADKVPLLN